MNSIHCKRFKVTGRVQGVFYRASTREQAVLLGVTGWVRNLAEGSVELLACGDAQQLAALEQWLWQGPELAQVHDIEIQAAALEIFADFMVRYDTH
ncbi:MAG: acylphosphatase [Gammaproteobacteria bacterium]|nr:acylphosphatase [Gammaproteobacteria bacterium]